MSEQTPDEELPQAPPNRFAKPLFVVAPPSSGSRVLAEGLAGSPSVWTAEGPEGGPVIDAMPALSPAALGWDSNRLTATDALGQEPGSRLRSLISAGLRNAAGEPPPEDATDLRLLDATPANALRIPFLLGVFPQAMFVYVYRDPRESLAGMLEGWQSGRHVTYPDLPDWDGPPWSYPLTPEWRALSGRALPEICVSQWVMTMRILLGDLEKVPPDRWCVVDFAALRNDPKGELRRLCEFTGLEWSDAMGDTIGRGAPETWRRREAEVGQVISGTDELAARARELIAEPPAAKAKEKGPIDPNSPTESPLRSVNSSNLVDILDQLGSSLLVSTYQTGKLVAIRKDGAGVNTHFRQFESPMGIDVRGGRMAVGTRSQVWEYHNVPSLLDKLQPPGKHDACFVPRRTHYTGDIRIHEIAYAADDLWIVNTRFSCLCTLDADHSFVPRWRPPFITKYAAEDRCHLNGLAVVDDQVKFVSMLGTSDEAAGWRENKARGGQIMDVPSSEPVITGLSMPHSPRWYRDRLWVLESGEGSIGVCDLDTGKVETVAQLPGFTRGLSFLGPLAFIGLSEVRESSTFGGLPLTGRLEERQCGVWVVNIETGQTIAFLRFEDLVQEIFAVHALPGVRFPEIAEHGSDAINLTFVLPDEALADSA
ncbi:MAG: TIGR03032 family protein [Solirubrobacterales bacterium]